MVRNFLQADLVGFLFLGAVFRHGLFILRGCFAQNTAQRCHHILGRDEVIAAGTDAILSTPGSIDDHMITSLIGDTGRIEIIDFLSGTELDVHDFHVLLRQILKFFHWFCSLYDR